MTRLAPWIAAVACIATGCFDLDLSQLQLFPDAPMVSAQISGSVVDSRGQPIADAQVCVPDVAESSTPPCANTDGSGTFVVRFSISPEYGAPPTLEVTASDYAPGAFDELDGGETYAWTARAVLTSEDAATALLRDQAGFAFPSTTQGFVRVSASSAAGTPITATIGTLGGSANRSAVYADSSGVPNPSLTATGSAGGDIYFGNLDAGSYEITFADGAGVTCVGPPSIARFGSNTIVVGIVAGALTVDPGIICSVTQP